MSVTSLLNVNKYSPVLRAYSSIAGKDATRQRPVVARVARCISLVNILTGGDACAAQEGRRR